MSPHDFAESPADWLFDLDNTLYPSRCDLFSQVHKRIRRFVIETTGFANERAAELQSHYFRTYGTTLNGLMRHYDVDPGAYLDYVHEIDYSPVPHDPALTDVLERLPGRKLVFTNGSRKHAESVLDRLGARHLIEDIFDIADGGYIPKPHDAPYEKLIARFNIQPNRTWMLDDLPDNLATARRFGMYTAWMRPHNHQSHACENGGRQDDGYQRRAASHQFDGIVDDLAAWLEPHARPRAD